MSFLLDTNICSAHLKRAAGLSHYFVQYSGRLYIPTPVLAELYTWANHPQSARTLKSRIETELLQDVVTLDFDARCALEFGRLNGELLRKGYTASPVDLMIAATAIVHDFTVVTHNIKDFDEIPGLRIADWLTS